MTHTERGTKILGTRVCPFCGGDKPRGQMFCSRHPGSPSAAWLLGYVDGITGEFASRREAETEFPTFTDDEIGSYLNGRDDAACAYRARMEG